MLALPHSRHEILETAVHVWAVHEQVAEGSQGVEAEPLATICCLAVFQAFILIRCWNGLDELSLAESLDETLAADFAGDAVGAGVIVHGGAVGVEVAVIVVLHKSRFRLKVYSH